MEVKINREIRDYAESVFFGMSLRQCVFAAAACAVAVALYFGLDPYLGIEELSWICILGAAPFAAVGFLKWHGMTAEQVAWAWVKSVLLTPKRLSAHPENLYYDAHEQEAKRAASPLARLNSIQPRAAAAEPDGSSPDKPDAPAPKSLAERANNLYVDLLASLYERASGKRDINDKDAR